MEVINTQDKRFKNGNGRDELGTVVTAEWLNSVQDELEGVITGFGGSINSSIRNQLYLAVKKALDAKASGSHSHVINDITGLQDALNSKAANGHHHNISDINDLQNQLNSKAANGHRHNISDINDLQNQLNSKAANGHHHNISDINDLQNQLNNKANNGNIYPKNRYSDTWYPNHYNGAEVFKLPCRDNGGLMITVMGVVVSNGEEVFNLPEAYGGFTVAHVLDGGWGKRKVSAAVENNNKVRVRAEGNNAGLSMIVIGFANF